MELDCGSGERAPKAAITMEIDDPYDEPFDSREKSS